MSTLVPKRILRWSHVKKVLWITWLLSSTNFVKKLQTFFICFNWFSDPTKIFSWPGSSFFIPCCLFFYVVRIFTEMVYLWLDWLFGFFCILLVRKAKIVLTRSKHSGSSDYWWVRILLHWRVMRQVNGHTLFLFHLLIIKYLTEWDLNLILTLNASQAYLAI